MRLFRRHVTYQLAAATRARRRVGAAGRRACARRCDAGREQETERGRCQRFVQRETPQWLTGQGRVLEHARTPLQGQAEAYIATTRRARDTVFS